MELVGIKPTRVVLQTAVPVRGSPIKFYLRSPVLGLVNFGPAAFFMPSWKGLGCHGRELAVGLDPTLLANLIGAGVLPDNLFHGML